MTIPAPGAEPTPIIARASRAHGSRSARRGLPVGVVGLVLVLAGAILQLVALLSAEWLDGTSDSDRTQVRYGFGDFADRTGRGYAHIYFAWGAWLLLALMLGCGVAACIRWRGGRTFRIVGGLLGVFGAFATIAGVLVFAYQTDVEIFHLAGNYAEGVYLAMLGLVASAIGAAAGEVGT